MSVHTHDTIKNLHLISHPLVEHKIANIRHAETSSHAFTQLVDETTVLLAYEATSHLPTIDVVIKTPMEETTGKQVDMDKIVILPILRAGLGMVNGLSHLLPRARVGHIGLFRDESTIQPQEYYFKIPENSTDSRYFICDPMLATGGSMNRTINELKSKGIRHITVLCIIAAPEGASKVYQAHPDVNIYTAALDRQLNAQCFILPGLGDAGDRLYGTK